MKVYSYGAWPASPVDEQVIINQMRLARRYYNVLVEIERWRRGEVEKVMQAEAPVATAQKALDGVLARLEAARAAVKARRKEARSASVPVPDLTAIRAELKVAKQQRKEARIVAREKIGSALKALTVEARARQRKARGEAVGQGLYWGTYLRIEQGFDQARRAIQPPRFQRFDGSGIVAVQVQKDHSPDGLYRVEGDGRKRVVLIRVGSDSDRNPIWARMEPVTFHRELPDARVTWVIVKSLRIGLRREWSVQFVVDEPIAVTADVSGAPAAAIDIGWRIVDGGRLVATLWDGDKLERLIVPESILRRAAKSNSLQSIRDREFNAVRSWLTSARADRALSSNWISDSMGRGGPLERRRATARKNTRRCEHRDHACAEASFLRPGTRRGRARSCRDHACAEASFLRHGRRRVGSHG